MFQLTRFHKFVNYMPPTANTICSFPPVGLVRAARSLPCHLTPRHREAPPRPSPTHSSSVDESLQHVPQFGFPTAAYTIVHPEYPSSLLSREILQIASNVIIGRSHLGVHFRMDGVYGATMGETGAIRRLQQVRSRSSCDPTPPVVDQPPSSSPI